MKKAYLIYKHGDGLTPRLYAFTEDKNMAKRFMNQRKESMFICKKKELTKNELNELKLKHGSSLLLRERGFKTEIDGIKSVTMIIVTEEEDMKVHLYGDDILAKELSKKIDPVSITFNGKLLKALDECMYFYFMKSIFHENYVYQESIMDFLAGIDQDEPIEYILYKYHIDELALFIKLFGYMMKK